MSKLNTLTTNPKKTHLSITIGVGTGGGGGQVTPYFPSEFHFKCITNRARRALTDGVTQSQTEDVNAIK